MLADQGYKSETFWETVKWWEIRRIPYNCALLLIGIIKSCIDVLFGRQLSPAG